MKDERNKAHLVRVPPPVISDKNFSGAATKLRNAVHVEKYGDYEIQIPNDRYVTRLLFGGVFLSETDYWRLSTFLSRNKLTSFYVSAMPVLDSKIFVSPYDMRVLKWAATDFCVTPAIIVEQESRFLQISNDVLRYTLVGISPDKIDEFDEISGGLEEYRRNTISLIDKFEIGFGKEDRDWAHEYLVPIIFDN